MPPSCPPSTQAMAAGVLSGNPRKLASAWSRVNSVSSSPCTISVGAVIWGSTRAIEERSSRLSRPGDGSPVSAVCRYSWQMSVANRPHSWGPWPEDPPGPAPPCRPLRKNSPAQRCLNTPVSLSGVTSASDAPVPRTACCGTSAWVRLCQVKADTTASTRGSSPAAIKAAAPPYEAPAKPISGSLPTLVTSGRAAASSITRTASRPSKEGLPRWMSPPEAPKPRAV